MAEYPDSDSTQSFIMQTVSASVNETINVLDADRLRKAKQHATLSAKNTDVYGKVTEISGNKISFDVETLLETPNSSNGQGTPPELPSGR